MSRIHYIDIAYESKKILEEINYLNNRIFTFKLKKETTSKISNILKLTFVKDILYFKFPGKLFGQIHKDMDINTKEIFQYYALIIPLENCQNLYVNWFDSKCEIDENIKRGFSPEIRVPPSMDPKDSILLESQKLNQSAIIKDINKWHNAENKSDNAAKFISIRFQDFVNYEKSLTLIKK